MDYNEIEKDYERGKRWGIAWPGHPMGGWRDTAAGTSLMVEPQRWALLFTCEDPAADYSYDDLALMRRDDGLVALLRTTGCSCPSPCDTWGVLSEGTEEDARQACLQDWKEWGGKWVGPFGEMARHLGIVTKDPA